MRKKPRGETLEPVTVDKPEGPEEQGEMEATHTCKRVGKSQGREGEARTEEREGQRELGMSMSMSTLDLNPPVGEKAGSSGCKEAGLSPQTRDGRCGSKQGFAS